MATPQCPNCQVLLPGEKANAPNCFYCGCDLPKAFEARAAELQAKAAAAQSDLLAAQAKRAPFEFEAKQTEDALTNSVNRSLAAYRHHREAGVASFSARLGTLIGEDVGIDISSPLNFEPARLIDVQQDYFSVLVNELVYCVPLANIIYLTMAPGGTVRTGFFSKFPVVIRIMNPPVYKGAIGVSVAL